MNRNCQPGRRVWREDKAIGAPMISLHAVQDLPNAVRQRLYFLRFEDLVERPAACMSHVYSWLGLAPWEIDTEKLAPMGPPVEPVWYCRLWRI